MKRKIVKRFGFIVLAGIILTGAVGLYMWFKPHRDIQATKAFAEIKVNDLVNKFTINASIANAKYLSTDGNSKVLIIEGRVSKVSTNLSNETVIVLKDEVAKVGVIATYTPATSMHTTGIKVGDIIKVKGTIAVGNSYDADLDLYEHAVLMQCHLVK